MNFIGVAATAGLIATTPVQGEGWEYARWGMAPSEVISASNGLAYLEDGLPRESVKAPFKMLGLEFRANFRFEPVIGLTKIRLRYQGACGNVTAAVQAAHGMAQEDWIGRKIWLVDGNSWSILPDGGICNVWIEPHSSS